MTDPAQTTSNQVVMMDQNGTAGLVDADKVESAKASGLEPAVKMQGPDGALGYVAESKVGVARQSKYQVTPDNPGVQRMATPQGQLTYALPSEVDQFKASGHVPINDNGNFQVEPLPGEDNTQTMARAATIAKNLPPEVMQKAIEAEKKTFPKRAALSLGTAAVAAPAILAAESGVGEVIDAGLVPAARAAGTALGTVARLAKTPIGQAIIKKGLTGLAGSAGGVGFAVAEHYVKKWLSQ